VEQTRERLLLGSGTSFDPALVQAFLQLLDRQPNFLLPQHIRSLPASIASYSAPVMTAL
jgi:HD-GYP domain-containing protein (c-di-GMP phosphodiesterase class II)